MPYEDQFGALSHPLRQQILGALQQAPQSVGDLTAQLPASQPVVSQHLKVLREAGLIRVTPTGMKRIYRIDAARLAELRQFLTSQWQTALQGLTDGDADV